MLSPYAKAIDSNTYEHLFKSLELKKFEFMATNSSTPSFSRNKLAEAAIFEALVVKTRFSSELKLMVRQSTTFLYNFISRDSF